MGRSATRDATESRWLRFTTRVVLPFTLAHQTQKQQAGLAVMTSPTKSVCSSPRSRLQLMLSSRQPPSKSDSAIADVFDFQLVDAMAHTRTPHTRTYVMC